MINSFRGEHRFLSNFHPIEIEYEGEWYPSVEHAYQAAKTIEKSVRMFFLAGSSGDAKKLGRSINLRPDWDQVKVPIMRELLKKKFTKGTVLADKLLSTGDEELIEGNWWGDCFWGVCKGKGENWLGKLLMEVRSELKGKAH